MSKITKENIELMSDIFHALSNPTRLDILFYLFAHGATTVTEIVEHSGLTQSGVSHQLKLLKQYKLVKSERDGKSVNYMLCDDHVISICSQMLEHVLE